MDIKINDKIIKDIKLIIFDKDGTIIDLHKYWSFVISKRAFYFSQLFKNNQDKIYNDVKLSMGLVNDSKISNNGPVGLKSRKYIIEIVLNILITFDKNITIEIIESGFNEVDKDIDLHFKDILQKLNGVDDLLKTLEKTECKLAIATTDVSRRVVSSFQFLNIEEYFDFIVGSDMVTNSKPSPDMIEKILNQYTDIKKDEIILIGDSMADLNMAENAKIKFIGVNTGLYSKEFMQKSEYFIEDLTRIQVISNV